MITLEYFKDNYDPTDYLGTGNFIIFYYDTATTTSGANISTVTEGGANIANTLKNLRTLTIDLKFSGDIRRYTFDIATTVSLDGYYHLVFTEPVTLGGNFDSGIIYNIEFSPAVSDLNFDKSDYDALKNNASANNTTSYIYDVDRSKYSNDLLPVNYQSIMSGSASPAQFQELNYSSKGILSSRYEGAKTSKEQYGVVPAIAGNAFEAAVYSSELDTGSICGLSIEERNIEEYIYAPNLLTQKDYIVDFRDDGAPQVGYRYAGGGAFPFGSINTALTNFIITGDVDTQPGDILAMKSTATTTNHIEIVKVEKVVKTSSTTTLTLQRAYKNGIIQNTAKQVSVQPNLHFDKVTGNLIYKTNGNEIYRVADKKLWLKEKNEIIYVDDSGGIISGSLKTCGI